MERSDSKNAGAARTVQEILEILHKWGIHTLGQLTGLDKEELRARLGPEAVRLWERANGISTRLLRLVQPPELFDESFEFEHEIETAEPLLFLLRRFLEQLALRLRAIYLVAKELTLRITFADKQIYERIFRIPQPTNDVDLLFRMLHTHLENFRSEHPIVAVALSIQPIKPAREQFGLFETTLPNPHQLSETLARLAALLGADRVGTPVLEETYRPDAFRVEPFSWNSNTGFQPVESAGVSACDRTGRQDACSTHSHDGCAPLFTALRRFRPAAPASVFGSEKVLVHLQSEKMAGKIVDQHGPYLSSGNWWDEKIWERAEWDLELGDGTIVRCHENPNGWQIDGIYD
jgi:protein ImuB